MSSSMSFERFTMSAAKVCMASVVSRVQCSGVESAGPEMWTNGRLISLTLVFGLWGCFVGDEGGGNRMRGLFELGALGDIVD